MPFAVLGRAAWHVPLFCSLLLVPLACSDDAAPVDATPAQDTSPDLKPDAGPDLAPADAAWLRPDGRPNAGQLCSSDWDCTAGLSCDTTLPGGMCTAACKVDKDCAGDGLVCHEDRCHPRCSARTPVNPCRKDYVCRLKGTLAACVPDCRVQQACSTAGWLCDANSGLCVDPKGGTIGAPCGTTVGSCDGTPNGVCLSLNTFSGSFCTVPCAPFTMPCPEAISGAQCIGGPSTAPLCVFLCDEKKPTCPNAKLSCQGPLPGGYHVCLP
jgi:hypothetical protein